MEQVWMDYKDYVAQKVWFSLKLRFLPDKEVIRIFEECSEKEFSKEVLEKYNIKID